MGEVWKARDTRLERTVAVKRLRGEYGDRFQKEALRIDRSNGVFNLISGRVIAVSIWRLSTCFVELVLREPNSECLSKAACS